MATAKAGPRDRSPRHPAPARRCRPGGSTGKAGLGLPPAPVGDGWLHRLWAGQRERRPPAPVADGQRHCNSLRRCSTRPPSRTAGQQRLLHPLWGSAGEAAAAATPILSANLRVHTQRYAVHPPMTRSPAAAGAAASCRPTFTMHPDPLDPCSSSRDAARAWRTPARAGGQEKRPCTLRPPPSPTHQREGASGRHRVILPQQVPLLRLFASRLPPGCFNSSNSSNNCNRGEAVEGLYL